MQKITRLAQELEALEIDSSSKYWTMYTTGIDFGVDEARKKIIDFQKDKGNFRIVSEALESNISGDDRRGVKLLYDTFKHHHYSDKANQIYEKIVALETKLNDLHNKHRAELNGRPVATTDITKILEDSPDRGERRKAFLARTSINKALVDTGFLELIHLRKEHADACGFPDFITFKLDNDELPATIFDGWRDELRKRSGDVRAQLNSMTQSHLQIEDFQLWDAARLKRAVCPLNVAEVDMDNFLEPIEKTFAAHGFDTKHLNLTYDIYPRKNKSEWGYMFNLKPCRDARILANVNNRFSSFNVLLHETGHGVHFLNLDPEEQLLNSGVSGIVAEGFANFFGDRSYSREFLSQIFRGDIEPIYETFQALRRVTDLFGFRMIMKTLFDHELYRQELRCLDDIHELYWDFQKDLLGLEPYAEQPAWGFVIHHTGAPVYLHNYFLGDVMCENMKKVFAQRQGRQAEESPLEFGRFWKEKVLQPSGRYPFPELYERVCESKMTLGPYLDACLRSEEPNSVTLSDSLQANSRELADTMGAK